MAVARPARVPDLSGCGCSGSAARWPRAPSPAERASRSPHCARRGRQRVLGQRCHLWFYPDCRNQSRVHAPSTGQRRVRMRRLIAPRKNGLPVRSPGRRFLRGRPHCVPSHRLQRLPPVVEDHAIGVPSVLACAKCAGCGPRTRASCGQAHAALIRCMIKPQRRARPCGAKASVVKSSCVMPASPRRCNALLERSPLRDRPPTARRRCRFIHPGDHRSWQLICPDFI
jgi:hypothetical protein